MTTKTAVAVELSQPESRRPGVCTAEGRVSVLTQSLWKSTEDLEWILILEGWNSFFFSSLTKFIVILVKTFSSVVSLSPHLDLRLMSFESSKYVGEMLFQQTVKWTNEQFAYIKVKFMDLDILKPCKN